ncbi:MAG: hypothetical protein AAF757_00970 [Cyanobacteria bacterium P01_D01_bin.116]
MYKLIATGLIAVNLLIAQALPLQAQSARRTNRSSCNAALTSAKNRIKRGRNVQLTTNKFSHDYSDAPVNRSHEYGIGLEGRAASSIFNSPVFMKSIASQIIYDCKTIGMVSFGAGYDRVVAFGLMPSGKVVKFKCLYGEGVSIKPRWGQAWC